MPGSPVTTSPVLTPVRTSSRTPQSRSSSSLSGPRGAEVGRGPTARRASSSLTTGMPNTATTASPTNFCTRPPWRSNSPRMWSNQRAMTTASDSGSSRWPSAPDPARSVNTTVTVLRAGRLAPGRGELGAAVQAEAGPGRVRLRRPGRRSRRLAPAGGSGGPPGGSPGGSGWSPEDRG